ncbi:MAG: transposase family protein [Desulfovibrionaceae bacterium]|nr:transposase family protein [Desulfovibrionaceae bacterium]
MSNVISISILKFFAQLNDPRQTAKVLYPLPEIILVALCAAICGADSFVEMEEFGNAKRAFLRNILPYESLLAAPAS